MATVQQSAKTGIRGKIDNFFQITERGSNFSREIRGGLVTFFAMSYIVVLNPLIIGTVQDGSGSFLGGGDEQNLAAVAAGTALAAGEIGRASCREGVESAAGAEAGGGKKKE